MCFFCFTTDLNYDPQKYGTTIANLQLGQKLCPNLHGCSTPCSEARPLSVFASGRLDARPHIGSRVPTNREG
jgi:hypothetical protein